MAVRYSFQCPECSAPVELTVTQAGQAMKCAQCGADFTAPRLGDIKRLPPVENADAAAKAVLASNSPVKGWLFSGGLLLVVIAGVIAYAIESYATSMYDAAQQMGGNVEQLIESERERVDAMPAADIYAIATEAGKDSFQLEYREQPHRSLSIQSKILQNIAYGFWAVLGVGMLMVLGSFFVGGSRKRS